MTTTAAVFKAWNAVIADLANDGIKKARKNSQGGGYMFRGIDDVLNALASAFARHGVAVRAVYSDPTEASVATKGGGSMVRVTLRGSYTLVSTQDGSTFDAGVFYGEAFDSGDKAIGKAMSYAFKAFAIQCFAIPTEGDNDTENQTHERVGTPPPQRQRETPPQAPPADDVPSRSIFITHGDGKGVSLYEATDAQLSAYHAYVMGVVDDPAKSSQRDRAIKMVTAIEAEQKGRRE